MEDTSVVVGDSKVGDHRLIIDVKVVFFSFLDVFSYDLDEIVTIVSTLLVIETESVEEFMNDGSDSEATGIKRVELEVELLHVILESHLGVATAVITCYIDVGFGIWLRRHETNATDGFDDSETSDDMVVVSVI